MIGNKKCINSGGKRGGGGKWVGKTMKNEKWARGALERVIYWLPTRQEERAVVYLRLHCNVFMDLRLLFHHHLH